MKNKSKQRMQAGNLLFFLILIIFVIFIIDLSSALPVLLSDQGTDAKNNGVVVAIGNITIFIYDNATAGNTVYNQTFVNNITNGSWNIMINPDLEFGRSYWKDYSINDQDLDFDGDERLEFNSPLGLINNVSFINFSLIDTCSAGSSIRKINENGSVVCETDDIGLSATSWINDSSVTYIDSSFPQNVNFTGNLTLGEKITFSLGEIIDNIIDGFIRITGGLNVTGNTNIEGNLTVDTNTLFVDSGSDRVGIGTTTPSGTLTVNSSNADGSLRVYNTTGSEHFFINGSTGRVGIGTSTPADFVTIKPNGNGDRITFTEHDSDLSAVDLRSFTGGGQITVSAGGVFDILLNALGTTVFNDQGFSNHDFRIEGDTNENLFFVDASTERVGIGTNVPTQRLDVNGSVNVTGVYYGNGSQLTSLTESQITDLQTYAINNTAGWILNFSNIYSADWTNVTITESQISDLQTYILASNEGNLNVNNSNSTDFWDNLNSPSDINAADITDDNTYLQVAGDTGTGNFIFNQNLTVDTNTLFVNSNLDRVGIGTISPTKKFHLANGTFLQTPGNPSIVGSVSDSASLSNAREVYVSGKYAYVVSSDNDSLSIIDVSNPTSPSIVGSVSDSANLNGSIGLYVSGKYAYVVNQLDDSFRIIDVANPTSPSIVGGVKDSSSLNGARNVYVSGKYAYVASEGNDSLQVIDVSDPNNPFIAGGVTGTALDGAYDVFVTGKYAYVANNAGNSVRIVDVSDPTSPSIVGGLQDNTNLFATVSVYVSGKYAYTTQANSDKLTILDVSNPEGTSVIVGSVTDSTNLDGPFGLFVSGKYAYVTGINGDTLTIVDVSNSTNPFVAGTISSGNLDGAFGVFVSGKYAYVASTSNDSLSIIDIGGIDAPSASIGNVEAGYLSVTDNVDVGNNLYVRNGLNVGPGGILSDGRVSFDNNTLSTDNGTVTVVGDLNVTGTSYLGNIIIPSQASWNVSTASFSRNFSVSAEDGNPRSLFFKPDGTKMYVLGASGKDVNEYDLSTAWNVSSASFNHLFSVNTQEASPTGVFFRSDGLKMFIVGGGSDSVNEYDLSIAWNVSNASFIQVSPNLQADEGFISGVFFKPDGLKMFTSGFGDDQIDEYSLSTAWNVSTVLLNQSFNISAQEGPTPIELFFRSDGLKMFVLDNSDNKVNEYDLSTSWDISTASFSRNFSVSAQDTDPWGIFFKSDGERMYIVGIANDDVYEYNLGLEASGNVGIGTANPTQALDVVGSVNISGVYYGDGGGLTGIGADSLNPGSINTTHILDGTILGADISNGTITAADLATSSVNSTHIVDGTILAEDIASAAVTNIKIAANAINTTQIIDSTITDADISDTTNLTLGQKITFTLGEVIDNIVDGIITITGGLDVSGTITGTQLDIDNLNLNGNTISATNDAGEINIAAASTTTNNTAGGKIDITAGQGNTVGSSDPSKGGNMTITAGTGGVSTGSGNIGGTGGATLIKGGLGGGGQGQGSGGTATLLGGDAPDSGNVKGGSGGAAVVKGGDVLGNTSANGGTSGTGGIINITGGRGGDGGGHASRAGGLGGNAFFVAGDGGDALTNASAGDGGDLSIDAGIGGVAFGTGADGTNGTISIGTANAMSITIGSNSLFVDAVNNRVGIGTTSPQAPLHINSTSNETLLRLQDVDGTCNQNPEAGSLTISCSSDEKLKENIREAESALEEFEDIEIKDYVVKASGKETTGVIAQEINKTHPELVHEEDGELFVEQPNPWKLLKAIQELQEMFKSLVGGNYSFSSTGIVVDKDSVGQAVVLLNSTSVRVEFSEEYATEPIVTVTPIGLPNFFHGVDNITTTGFNIVISEAQEKEVVFNWHAFARPVKEIDVNLTNVTEDNITNGTVLGNESLNITIGNETIDINDTITNGTIEDINETVDEGNETVEPIEEIPELNETIDENNKSEEEINQTVVVNETEDIEIGENLTDSNESVEGIGDNTSVEETSVQQELSQDLIGGSLITGGIIGINEEQGNGQGIFSRLFGMILDLMEGTRDE